MMMAIVYSLDTSIRDSIIKGTEKKERHEILSHRNYSPIYLFTKDKREYYENYEFIIHIPCGLADGLLGIICYYFISTIKMIQLKNNFNIIKVHGSGCINAAITSMLYNIPLMVLYGYQWYDFRNEGKIYLLYREIGKLMEYYLFYISKIVITQTKTLALIAENNGARNIHIIKKGIEIGNKNREDDLYVDKKNGEINLLYVGRLSEIKGIRYLLQTMVLLKNNGSSENVKLKIIGMGDMYEYIVHYIGEHNLGCNVELLGYLENEKVLDEMTCAHLLFMPSHREGSPRVIVEAFSTGLPVLGSDVAGINDFVSDGINGILVPLGDVNKMVNVILTLSRDDSLLYRLSENASRSYAEFDINEYYNKLNEIIIELIV